MFFAFRALVCACLTFCCPLRAQDLQWVKGLGGSTYDMAMSTAVDQPGNVYTIGTYYGEVDFDPGPGTFSLSAPYWAIYISKLDAAGDFVWAKKLDGKTVSELVIDASGNLYVSGTFEGMVDLDPGAGTFTASYNPESTFLLKLDDSGNFLWARVFGGSSGYQYSHGLTIDAAGDVCVLASFTGGLDLDPGTGTQQVFSSGQSDIFIVKLSSDGDFVWGKTIGGSSYDYGFGITHDASSNLYFCGGFYQTCDFDPGPGIAELSSIDGEDAFVCKFSSNGDFAWVKQMGGSFGSQCRAIKVDGNGDIVLTGNFSAGCDFDPGPNTQALFAMGNTDAFVAKLDNTGDYLWAKRIGGMLVDGAFGLALNSGGQVFVSGFFDDGADFDPDSAIYYVKGKGLADAFILCLSGSGGFNWVATFGGDQEDYCEFITADETGFLYASGYFSDTCDFDPGPQTNTLISNGNFDAFVLKMKTGGLTDVAQNPSGRKLNVYPNPAGNFVVLSTPEGMSGSCVVCDQTGRILIKGKLVGNSTKLDLSQLEQGVYIVETVGAVRQRIRIVKME